MSWWRHRPTCRPRTERRPRSSQTDGLATVFLEGLATPTGKKARSEVGSRARKPQKWRPRKDIYPQELTSATGSASSRRASSWGAAPSSTHGSVATGGDSGTDRELEARIAASRTWQSLERSLLPRPDSRPVQIHRITRPKRPLTLLASARRRPRPAGELPRGRGRGTGKPSGR